MQIMTQLRNKNWHHLVKQHIHLHCFNCTHYISHKYKLIDFGFINFFIRSIFLPFCLMLVVWMWRNENSDPYNSKLLQFYSQIGDLREFPL